MPGYGGFDQERKLEVGDHGVFTIGAEGNTAALRRLLRRYADLPTSLADVGLVRLAELFPESSVLTTDAHFQVYRKEGRKVIPMISP